MALIVRLNAGKLTQGTLLLARLYTYQRNLGRLSPASPDTGTPAAYDRGFTDWGLPPEGPSSNKAGTHATTNGAHDNKQ